MHHSSVSLRGRGIVYRFQLPGPVGASRINLGATAQVRSCSSLSEAADTMLTAPQSSEPHGRGVSGYLRRETGDTKLVFRSE